MLVELLLTFALEEDLVRIAVFLLEAYRGGDVEVVHEARHVQQHGVAILYAGVSSTTTLSGLCIPL